MFNRLIAHNGLPLKIQTQWTKNVYWDRRDPKLDELYIRGYDILVDISPDKHNSLYDFSINRIFFDLHKFFAILQ